MAWPASGGLLVAVSRCASVLQGRLTDGIGGMYYIGTNTRTVLHSDSAAKREAAGQVLRVVEVGSCPLFCEFAGPESAESLPMASISTSLALLVCTHHCPTGRQ